MQFSLTHSSLYSSARGTYKELNPLANVTVLGVESAVTSVMLNGVVIQSGWTYNETSKVLDVKALNNITCGGAWSQDWVLRWS